MGPMEGKAIMIAKKPFRMHTADEIQLAQASHFAETRKVHLFYKTNTANVKSKPISQKVDTNEGECFYQIASKICPSGTVAILQSELEHRLWTSWTVHDMLLWPCDWGCNQKSRRWKLRQPGLDGTIYWCWETSKKSQNRLFEYVVSRTKRLKGWICSQL